MVIEHNLDVIKTADYLIDLGPEGGNRGGTIVATGSPEAIVKANVGYTGKFLGPVLDRTMKLMKQYPEGMKEKILVCLRTRLMALRLWTPVLMRLTALTFRRTVITNGIGRGIIKNRQFADHARCIPVA